MSPELVHSQPTVETFQRVLRLQMDALTLRRAPLSEVRQLYDKIESARDALSGILDRADGKDA